MKISKSCEIDKDDKNYIKCFIKKTKFNKNEVLNGLILFLIIILFSQMQ